MPINNRGAVGQPSLPYADFRVYAGTDIFIDLTFLDHTGVLVQPTVLTYQIDDLTNALNVVSSTPVTVTGSQQTLQISGALLQMSKTWQGSEIWQISWTATLPGSPTSTVKGVTILELIAIQTS